MQTSPHTAVIIPVFNEGPVVLQVIRELLKNQYTVVVVEDGSAETLQPTLQGLPVYFLRHRANLGQGAALQTGIEFIRKLKADYIVCIDADGQHDPAAIPALLAPLLNNEADVVLGSRFLEKNTSHIPFGRKLVLQAARFINYLFSGLLLSDAHNGFRAFNVKTLEQLELTENRMAHASEFLFEIKKHGWRFKEIGVDIAYTDYSKSKGQSTLQSIRILFDLILHKLFK